MNSSRSWAPTRFSAAFYSWLRGLWTVRIALRSDVALALVASLAWAVLYNLQFWHQAIGAMWHATPRAVLFLLSLFVAVVSLQGLLLALVPTRLGLRIATSALFVVAALSSYFASAYGAVMNQDMMRNVLETDPAEIGGLINFDLLAHVLLLGVLPAVLVWRVALPSSTWRVRLRQRLVFIGSSLALCAAALFACSANYAVFFRVNAYDNSIAYTDYVLSRQIELLQANADRLDGMLIYVSDHGESLGEQGIYLHGMPYSFAPRVQKEVPMLLWASPGYVQRTGLGMGCVRARAHEAVSHDNLYHTVLGALAVRDAVYDPALDILSGCRSAVPQNHE